MFVLQLRIYEKFMLFPFLGLVPEYELPAILSFRADSSYSFAHSTSASHSSGGAQIQK